MASTFAYERKEVLLKVANLSVVYGDRVILADVDFEIRDVVRPDCTIGQVVGLLGPSGRGKTQLFHRIAGIAPPTSGSVLIGVEQVPVKRGMVGVVAQHYPLFSHRTVLGNLIVAGRQAGLSRADSRDKAGALLERFKLTGAAGQWPATLSGGQRQRIAIAQQLMCSSHFLLMDEPFSGLDPIMVDEVAELVSEVQQMDELNTVIVVTHDIAAAVTVSDTLLLLGYEYDEEGRPLVHKGAKIQGTYDLIERGLAWHKGIVNSPEFAGCVREVRARFARL